LTGIRRAVSQRNDIRFKLTPEDIVANNFKISKHTIDVAGFNIPTVSRSFSNSWNPRNHGLEIL